MAIPVPVDFVDNEVVTAEQLNVINDAVQFFLNKPAFKGGPETTSVTGTYVQLPFDTRFIDNTQMYDPSTPKVIKVKEPGVYQVYAQANYQSAAPAGGWYIQVRRGTDAVAYGEIGPNTDGNTVVNCSTLTYLGVDDEVSVWVKQSSNYSATANGGREEQTHLTLTWVSRDL